jgi:hypothetical protein
MARGSTAQGGTVSVDGLSELLKALRKTEGKLAPQLRKEMKARIGKPFTTDVKTRIAVQGLYKSGRLSRSIKPAMSGSTLTIRSAPALNPGPKSRMGYAAIYEYGFGKSRAFLEPEMRVWAVSGKTEAAFADFLDYVETEFGRN